jgi:hypothetical protein
MPLQLPIALAVTCALIFSPNVSTARAQQKSLTAGLPVEAAATEKPADLTAATDNLAKLLGKKKRSFNKPWYDGLES